MRFLSLTLQNFMSYRGEARVDLAGQGLVAVLGVNEVDPGQDSNGAGKSTVLDALLWGLYGETGPRRDTSGTPSGVKADDVVNDVAGEQCIVVVELEDDAGSRFRVERWRKAKDAAAGREKALGSRLLHYLPGDGWLPVADLDKDNVQEEIERVLGFDYALASQILVRSQEDNYNFAQSTPKERFDTLTQIEGVEELDAAEARARERGRALVAEDARVQGELTSALRSIELFREEDFAAKIEEWEAGRAQRIAGATEALREEEAQRTAKAAEVDKRATYQAQLADLDAQLATMVPPAEPEGMAAWREHAREVQIRAHEAETAHGVIVARIGELHARGPGVCGECGQGVSPAHIEQRRGELESEATTAQNAVIEARAESAQANKVIEDAQASMREHGLGLQAAREKVAHQRGLVSSVLASIDVAERELADTRRLDRVRESIAALEGEANPFTSQQEDVERRIGQLQETAHTLEAEAVRVRTDAQLMEWWIRNLPSLKAWIFDSVVGEITASANRWLTHLMGGSVWCQVESTTTTKAGAVRDKIGLRLFKWLPDGTFRERPYKLFSGGEHRRISLALDWALADRLAQRAHATCGFLALDEIDRHLDDAGREGLLASLAELRAEKETVLVISHDEALKCAPDRQWVVVKSTAGSRIEERYGSQEQDQDAGRTAH